MATNMWIQFDLDDRLLASQLVKLRDRLSNPGLQEFLEQHADPYLKQRVQNRFSAEGDDAVGMWVPLDPATVVIRQGLGYGGAHPINVRTHDMVNYLLHSGPDVGSVSDGMELTFPAKGAPSPIQDKIKTAQQGKPLPLTPPRPVVAISGTDDREIGILLADYLMDGLIGGII